MMTLLAAGGVLGVAVAGQSGMDQIAQAMGGDVSMSDVVKQAEQITGLGISTTDAGLLIAALVFAMRLVDANRGLFITLNDWIRRVLGLHPVQPPPPPGSAPPR